MSQTTAINHHNQQRCHNFLQRENGCNLREDFDWSQEALVAIGALYQSFIVPA